MPLLVARQGRDLKAFAALVLLPVAAAAFMVSGRVVPGPRTDEPSWSVMYAAGVWMVVLTASLAVSPSPAAGDEWRRQVHFLVVGVATFWLLKPGDREKLAALWGLALSFVFAYAVIQKLGLEPVEEFRKFHPESRVFSTFGNPDFLGAHTAFLLPLFAASGLSSSPPRRKWWLMAAATSGLVLFWTLSRGAWLGAAAGLVAALLAFPRRLFPALRPWHIPAALAGVAMVALLAVPREALFRRTDRVMLWQGTALMVAARPLTGWGLSSFVTEYAPFAPREFAERMKADNTFAEHPHSEYLNVAVEGGLPALGVFLWLLVIVLRVGFRAARRDAAAAGAFGALVAVLVHVSVDRNFRLASTAVPFWILAGSILVPKGPRPVWQIPRLALAAALALMAVCATLALRPLAASYRTQADPDFLKQAAEHSSAQLEALQDRMGGSPDYWLALGTTYAKEGRFQKAADSFTKALSLDPGRSAAANNLGNSLFMMSRFEEAVTAYRKALALDPRNIDARFNMAYALFHQRKIKEAMAECDNVLRQDPTYHKAVQLKQQLAP